MKKITLVLFIITFNLISCQQSNQKKMLAQFTQDLFDETIPANIIIDKYIDIDLNKKSSLSLDERKDFAKNIIIETRKGKSENMGWLIPNYEIKNIKKPKVDLLKKHKDLDSLGVASFTKYEDNIYILLDSNKERILQYFLLNDAKNKIISFSLFIKSDNLAWFFVY
ncbi:hypothetical protein [uncultured Algibacter sp.]|uniref:hypothetical protein n=1 Tax=uncultured Algibacter sp. TaxID=298659 RepID=UPI002629D550|nr:hypothetical protein [uncultured Algibacter sp.]